MIKTKIIVQCLRVLWVLLILSNEYFVFMLSARNCASNSHFNYTNTPSIVSTTCNATAIVQMD